MSGAGKSGNKISERLPLLKRLLALFLGCVIALVIAEVILRAFNPFGMRLEGDRVILPVNFRYVVRDDRYPKLPPVRRVSYNSLGFRGEEPPRDFIDYLTIVAVGGSTTECRVLSDERSWPALLGNLLKKRFERLWINNAGLSGHSTFGHLILLDDVIIKLRPRYVIFLIGINDIGQNRLIPERFATLKSGLDISRIFEPHQLRKLLFRSKILSLLLNLYRAHRAQEIGLGDARQIDPDEFSQIKLTEKEIARIKEQHRSGSIKGYEKRVKKMIELCRDNGMEPILVTQPALYGAGFDPVTGVDLGLVQYRSGWNGRLGWEILELYNETTRKIGKDNRVLVIDLANQMPKDSRLYYDMMHFTEEGASMVADLIAGEIIPYLEKRHPGSVRGSKEDF